MMKHGCIALVLKQKCSHCSGWKDHKHDQKSMSQSLKCEGDVDFF